MDRENMVLLRKLLEESMGDLKHEYDGWKFDNEFHRIYTYMKNWHIDVYQWEEIIDFLNEVYEQDGVLMQN
jgi:hypothetical protein